MSSFKSDLGFTPIRPRQSNDRFNNNIDLGNSSLNNRLNDNISDKFFFLNKKNIFHNQSYQLNNNSNIFQNQQLNYIDNLNEINNFNPCYILITNFDNYSKESLFNFIEQQGIISRDIKNIGNDKMIIKFINEGCRLQFINNYNKVKDNFYGVRTQFIDENTKERIINNNANRIAHNISYSNNNYINNDINMVQFPEKKNNFLKFLDVFLNL